MNNCLALARATLLSLLRNRLTSFTLVLLVAFTALSLLMSTVDAGIRIRLFENILISVQTFLLYAVSWLFAFDLLRREQQELLYVLPLSTGISRSEYLCGRFLGLVFFLVILGACLLFLDALLLLVVEENIVMDVLLQIALTMCGAVLAAALVFALAVWTSAFAAVIFAVMLWVIGHGLDELIVFADQQLPAGAFHVSQGLYYLLPNFSITDMSTHVLNRLPMSWQAWLLPALYCLGYSALIMALACQAFHKKALVDNR